MESIRLGSEEISNLNSIVATAKKKEDKPVNEEYDSDAGQEGGFQTLLTQQVKEETEKLEKKINAIQNKNERLEEKLDKNQTQYITILGIFASIVLAFVGAFTFSTSVLSHMHQVSIYRLVFVILCIAFFISNILQGLFEFLTSITKDEKKQNNSGEQKMQTDQGFIDKLKKILSANANAFILCLMLINFIFYCINRYSTLSALPSWISDLAFLLPS